MSPLSDIVDFLRAHQLPILLAFTAMTASTSALSAFVLLLRPSGELTEEQKRILLRVQQLIDLIDFILDEADEAVSNLWGLLVRRRNPSVYRQRKLYDAVALKLLVIAVHIAGPGREARRNEWLADLAGSPNDGVQLAGHRKVSFAFGLVVAASKMRGGDSLDWYLRSDTRICWAVFLLETASISSLMLSGGFRHVVENWENLAAAGAGVYSASVGLGRVRGVRPRRKTDSKQVDGESAVHDQDENLTAG